MKKLATTILTLLTCGAAYALPVGNPADPMLIEYGLFWDDCCEDECFDPCDNPCGWDWDFGLRFGYYGDFVFNRNLEVDDEFGKNIRSAEFYTNAGLIVLNLWDSIDIYATLGGTEACIEGRAYEFGIIGFTSAFTIETETDFSWSVGVRGILWECGCTAIGLDARYFRTHPAVRRVTIAGELGAIYPDDELELSYREWQVSLGIAHRINMFVPYFAVKWAKARVEFDGDGAFPFTFASATYPDLENRKHWGYAFGVSWVVCDIMSINVEGRLRDDEAVAVNAQIQF